MMDARARCRWVEEIVAERCFRAVTGPLTFGAELELLAFDSESHAISPIFPGANGMPATLDLAREVGSRLGWAEHVSDKGVPRFRAQHGGALTFEPGGQLEYASGVHLSVDGLLRDLCAVETVLTEAGDARGMLLMPVGVDPFNGPDAAPLQLDAPRYSRMARYFASIGIDGARMMRQTASVQVNVGGIPVRERWVAANAIAPWLVALFANSSRYAGVDTACASYRSETWRGVDVSRTGVFAGGDSVGEYARFALGARAFLADDAAPPFGALRDDQLSDETLEAHLSTLFPEMRPRGYLEIRSLDAIGAQARTVAVALIAGSLADETAAHEVAELLGPPDEDLLRRAGRYGREDPRIAAATPDLIGIAERGCRRLGTTVISERSVGALRDVDLAVRSSDVP